MTRLTADGVTLSYGDGPPVVIDLDLEVPDGRICCIVGPNACGKSTLLRALARLLRPATGAVLLDGQAIHTLRTKEVARRLGLLPQSPTAPEGLRVEDLVARGRFPHQRLFQQWSDEDEFAVANALAVTGTDVLADRPVDELSGGQRQRVWIAMALAQETPILLLDEPTTYLDIAHQLEVLDLLAELNRTQGRTIVMVLHDLNEAARYSHHLVAMNQGRIVARGAPDEVVTEDTVRAVFGIDSRVIADPVTGTPMVVPVGAGHRQPSTEPPLARFTPPPHAKPLPPDGGVEPSKRSSEGAQLVHGEAPPRGSGVVHGRRHGDDRIAQRPSAGWSGNALREHRDRNYP